MKSLVLTIVFCLAISLNSFSSLTSVEVKGFDHKAKDTLSKEIRDRRWTEVRSSLYDDIGGARLYIVMPQSKQARTSDIAKSFKDYKDWIGFAEKHRSVLIFPDPGDDLKWDSSDLEYLNALYNHCSKYRLDGTSKFIAAYGDAGIPASLFAISKTRRIAGVAFIEAEIGNISENNIIKEQLPLAAYIINTKSTSCKQLINYLKTVNNITRVDKIKQNETLYFREGSSPWNSNYSKSHFIRIVNKTKESYPSLVFNNLFNAVVRWRTINGEGNLRHLEREGQINGLVKISENTAPARDAFVYIPSAIKKNTAKGPFPLVMVFHGRRCTGDYIIDQAEWHKIAEENNFIVYAPNGFDYDWNIFEEKELADDYSYFSSKVDDFGTMGIKVEDKTYSIDSSRVYAFGYSNGAYFTSGLAMKYPRKFAAAAIWAGGVDPEQIKSKPGIPIPVWYGIGEKDHYYKDWEVEFNTMGNYFISAAQADKNKKTTIYYPAFGIENLIETTIYQGSVEVRDSRAKKMEHGCINELTRYVWDDFFSKYKKQNGKSVLIK